METTIMGYIGIIGYMGGCQNYDIWVYRGYVGIFG